MQSMSDELNENEHIHWREYAALTKEQQDALEISNPGTCKATYRQMLKELRFAKSSPTKPMTIHEWNDLTFEERMAKLGAKPGQDYILAVVPSDTPDRITILEQRVEALEKRDFGGELPIMIKTDAGYVHYRTLLAKERQPRVMPQWATDEMIEHLNSIPDAPESPDPSAWYGEGYFEKMAEPFNEWHSLSPDEKAAKIAGGGPIFTATSQHFPGAVVTDMKAQPAVDWEKVAQAVCNHDDPNRWSGIPDALRYQYELDGKAAVAEYLRQVGEQTNTEK